MFHVKHHQNLPLVYNPCYSIPWDPRHRFPMAKYRLLYERLVATGMTGQRNVHISSPVTRSQLLRAHHANYIDRFIAGELTDRECRQLGLVWSPQLVKRTLTAVGGTLLSCRLAHRHGMACHLAGGTHHAFAASGSGFCVFNDIAVAALDLIHTGAASQVLIIDCDVHQGDGTASILSDEPRIFTCSVHARTNYPFEKATSNLDVELDKGTGDGIYLNRIEQLLAQLEQMLTPDFVLYDGGSDVHTDDRLGHLNISDEGIRQRDSLVLSWAAEKSIPVACVIGGGYDHDHQELARRHALLPEAASDVWRDYYGS